MYLRWEGETPLADREMIATLYEVSVRTVRRHCQPASYEPRRGHPPGQGGIALYDALAAGDQLAGVAPRPQRTLTALRWRINTDRERARLRATITDQEETP